NSRWVQNSFRTSRGHFLLAFIELAQSIEHELGGRTQHGARGGGGAGDKFVHAALLAVATLHDVNNRVFAHQLAALGVGKLARIEEDDAVNVLGIDVQ